MYRILVVEDDYLIRDFIKVYFESREIKVIEATDGLEAIQQINENFDLVLLDIMMPHLNGYEVCEKLRVKKQTPIIFISALSEDE
ncbi:MAG: response regulator, partial [Anaerorhabdus sp.]